MAGPISNIIRLICIDLLNLMGEKMKTVILAILMITAGVVAVYSSEGLRFSASVDGGEVILGWLQHEFTISGNFEINLPALFAFNFRPGFRNNAGFGIIKLGAECRFYWPFSPPEGLFASLGVEYWLVNIPQGSVGDFWESTFVVPVRVGYKWIPDKNTNSGAGAFVEPYIGYQFPLWTNLGVFVMDGFIGGLWGGVNVGWAF